jgi:hypothetical protein
MLAAQEVPMVDRPKDAYIGCMLEGAAAEAVDALRVKLAEFGATPSNSPPHLTLFYPFHAGPTPALAAALAAAARECKAFTVPVIGFAAFAQDVWFLAPKQDRALDDLRLKVRAAVQAVTGLEERPERIRSWFHVTLAKKYPQGAHDRIGGFLLDQAVPIRALRIDHLALFRRPAPGRWASVERFPFG